MMLLARVLVIFACVAGLVRGQSDSTTDCDKLDFTLLPKTCCQQPFGNLFVESKLQGYKDCKGSSALLAWANSYQLNNFQSQLLRNFIDDKSKAYLSTVCPAAIFMNCIFSANGFFNETGSINIGTLKAHIQANAPNTTWSTMIKTILDPMDSVENTNAYPFTDIVEDNFEKVTCSGATVNMIPLIMMQMLQSEIIWMCPKQNVYTTTNKCSATMKNFQYCDGKIYSQSAKGVFFFPGV